MTRRTIRFQTEGEDLGIRLDQVLARRVEGLSRTQARTVLGLGGVFVDGKRTKVASRAVRAGQDITVHLGAALTMPEKDEAPFVPVVVHDDAHLIVVDKPSGLFSAPTPESDRNNLHVYLEKHLGAPLHLLHRLDRPTSGLIAFAKNPAAAAHFSAQFRDHTIGRSYRAIGVGLLAEETVRVDVPLEGRDATTIFRRLDVATNATLFAAELLTGRTHQVRLHAEHLGHPLAGDSKYGRALTRRLPRRAPRLALHAEALAVTLPSGERLELHAAFPEDLEAYWTSLKNAQ